MKRCLSSRFLAVVATVCFLLIAVSGFAQFQTGNVYGKVQAKDGSVLPGVTVVLTGVGAPQTTTTDAQGNFRFISLSPGTYSIKAELAGYGTATRAGVGVRVGSNADVTMTLNPSVSESITVTAEAPLLDVRKAGTAINVSRVELEKIPTSRDPWTILQQAPSVAVDRMNVGGSQSGQQSVYIAKGAGSSQNTWNMDGVNITDEGATGSSPLYFDFDSFEEMQITTGGSDPRIQTPGVQLNMVTKRGSNDFKGSARDFYTPGSYQAAAGVPAEASTYLDKTNRINFVRDFGAEVGGPIWRDHLWFWAAGAENKISNQASQSPGAIGAFDNIILRDKNAKLNAQIFPSNSAVGFYTWGDKVRNARSIGPQRPFETAYRQTGPTKIYKLEDTQIFGSSLYLTGMWSKVSGGFSLIPNGGITDSVIPFRDLAGVWHNSFFFYSTVRPQKQYRVDGSKFLDMGHMNHELKFGFGYRSTPVSSQSGWPGVEHGYVRYRSANYCATRLFGSNADGSPKQPFTGTQCYSTNLYRNRNASFSETYNDLYVGDTILMGNLTIQAGLRWDRQKSANVGTSSAGNPVIGTPITVLTGGSGSTSTGTFSLPGITYPGDPQKVQWKTLSPRIGVTYALGSDRKTLLRAGYNRYVNQIGSTVSALSPLGAYSYLTFLGDDKNGDKSVQRNELLKKIGQYNIDPANPASIVSTTRADYGMKTPHSDELIAGFERELLSDFSVGVNYSYRKYHDLLYTVGEHTQGKGDFYTSADYVSIGATQGSYDIFDPSGTKVIYHVVAPVQTIYGAKNGDEPFFFVLKNRPHYSQTFNGLELTATKRLSHKWMLRGNISWNDWKEHSGAGSFYDPTPVLLTSGYCGGNCNGSVAERSQGSGNFGNVFINSKWTVNMTGLYQLPWDFSLGASLTARQGYPQALQEEVGAGPTGDENVLLGQIGSRRFDNVYDVDIRAAKDFRIMNRVGITVSADLFNSLNKRTVLQRDLVLSNGTGNYITEMQSPRVWRFGARFSF
jgi:hypothetical protein